MGQSVRAGACGAALWVLGALGRLSLWGTGSHHATEVTSPTLLSPPACQNTSRLCQSCLCQGTSAGTPL